jgi:GNAT superfamily N-acetyltransferase
MPFTIGYPTNGILLDRKCLLLYKGISMITIKELNKAELSTAYPLVSQLRPHLSEVEYINIATHMIDSLGYQVFCLYDGDQMCAYKGFAILTNLYDGKHIWVYDLVTDANIQGKGYGKQLLTHLESYAKENGVSLVTLSSGFARVGAHQFYEHGMSYNKVSYVFKKIM